MKKIVWVLGLMLLADVRLQAQSEDKDNRNKYHIGLKAGLNYSNVFDEEGEDFVAEPKVGFAGGVFIALPLGTYFGIHPEVLVSQKGFRGTGSLLGSTYEMRRTTTYLDVPLMIAFKPSRYITVLGGPQYSYLFNQTDLFTNGYSTAIQEQEFENDDIRKNILSASMGLDINLGHFIISGRYAFDLLKNNGDGSAETPRYKNTWLQGTLGFQF